MHVKLTKTYGSWIWPSCSMLNEWGSTHPEGQCKIIRPTSRICDALKIYFHQNSNVSTITTAHCHNSPLTYLMEKWLLLEEIHRLKI